jgi:hypothetical protein
MESFGYVRVKDNDVGPLLEQSLIILATDSL